MLKKVWLFLCLSGCVFAAKIPESTRMDCALKLHRGFCLQSVGQSTSAAFIFNEGYREAIAAGISPKKMMAIGNLFMWYRKYGHYLGLFETSGRERITDEYWSYSTSAVKVLHNQREKKQEAREIAEISRDMIFGVAEVIGGLIGVAVIPEIATKVGAGFLGGDGISRIWNGLNRLKTKNDVITRETRARLKEIEAVAHDEY